MTTNNISFEITLDLTRFNKAMRTAAQALHLAAAPLSPDHPRRRCGTCSPMSNPEPLSINGHKYAQRQRNRKGKV